MRGTPDDRASVWRQKKMATGATAPPHRMAISTP
jgi:hypothetical protein